MDNFDLKKYLTEGRLLKEDIDREIVSYIADTYIQNAKGGDRRYSDFLDLNVRDAVQDVLGILQSSNHPLHDETKKEYSIVKRDKAKGIFETEGSSLKENQLDDFLADALGGIDSDSANQVIYREDLIDMYDEGSDAVKDFDFAYDLVKSGRVKNYSRDMGDYTINYQLSIEDESDPSIRIIARTR